MLIVTALLCAFLLVPGGAAADLADDRDYRVTAGYDEFVNALESVSPQAQIHTIGQNGIEWFSVNVPEGTTKLSVKLDWGDTSDVLALTVYDPISAVGTYYDSDDGITDGCTCFSLSQSFGILPGEWHLRVVGEDVEGTEDYTMQHKLS
ncbi:hypothetical protein [uncultured Methanofollis sp.]|uniref:hypothetical protein n=1 Tax=uncultured Methanofollis sp. TaxID=262500 RepID=UPI0026143452|nr:hypothetical protein [uncultured Methanofollis sp.]